MSQCSLQQNELSEKVSLEKSVHSQPFPEAVPPSLLLPDLRPLRPYKPGGSEALFLSLTPLHAHLMHQPHMWLSGAHLPSVKRSGWTNPDTTCEAKFYQGRTQKANRHLNLLDRTLCHIERRAGILCSPLKQIGAVQGFPQKHWLKRLR